MELLTWKWYLEKLTKNQLNIKLFLGYFMLDLLAVYLFSIIMILEQYMLE